MKATWSTIERRLLRRSALTALLVVILTACAASHLFGKINLYDEGFANVNAMRIGQGQLPYRDYWTVYGPAGPYLLHLMHRLFGEDLLTTRLTTSVIGLGVALGAARLAGGMTPNRWSVLFLLPALAAWTYVVVHLPGYAMWPALLCAVGVLLLLRDALARPATGLASFGMANLTVLASLFRQDVGAYLFLSMLGGLWASTLCGPHQPAPGADRQRPILRAYAVWTVGLGGLAWAAMALLTGIDPLVQSLLIDPSTVLQRYRRLPLPSPVSFRPDTWEHWVLYGMLPLSLLAMLRQLLRAHFRSCDSNSDTPMLAVTVLLGCLLSLQIVSRPDRFHAAPCMLMFIIALARLQGMASGDCGAVKSRQPLARAASAWLPAGLLAVTGAIGATVLTEQWQPAWRCQSGLPRASCLPVSDEVRQTLATVNRLSGPEDPVFIGNTRHDRIWVNDVSLYFLLGRRIPVKWHEMHPGIVTESPTQRQMVDQLVRNDVWLLVLFDAPIVAEPNASQFPGSGSELDRHVAAHFVPAARNGRYTVMLRRDHLATHQP